jgi:HSP20 family molecular chaperone IbpA
LNAGGSAGKLLAGGASQPPKAEAIEVEEGKVGRDQESSKESAGPKVRERLSERPVGCLQRSFTFPEQVDYKNLKAKLGDGLLRVKAPKAAGTSGGDLFSIDIDE